jgi:PPM family protein phosphatase
MRFKGDGLDVAARSDVGRVRKENQDFMGFFQNGPRRLLVVADGMGGHSGGYEASRIAVARIAKHFAESRQDPDLLLVEASRLAHEAVVNGARRSTRLAGMGTTVVMCLLQGDAAWIGHVGDSRAYLVRGGESQRLTRDHTQVNRMVDAGMLTEDEAENHKMGHVLDRSLGSDTEPRMDLQEPLRLHVGDRLVLCSDGFSNMVPDAELAEIFQARDLDQAVQRGIGVALLRGGPDNTTIGAVQIGELAAPGGDHQGLVRAAVTAVVALLIGLLLGLALG